jgi:hypothetical protein
MVKRGLLAGIVLAIGITGCGQTHRIAQPNDPAAVVHLLEHDGYKPPEVPKPPSGSGTAQSLGRSYNPYGKPVAYLRRDSLDVLVVRGTSSSPKVPALWLRSGSAVVFGYPRSPAGIAQWGELAKTL